MAMKIQFEADVKNAQEVTRWLRDIEKHMNNVTTTSEGFTKSMLSGIEAIQKASSSMNLKGGMKQTFEDFGNFKKVAKESADILRGYFADSAKKAEQAATTSFNAIGREMGKVQDQLKNLKKGTDEYRQAMSELGTLQTQMQAAHETKTEARQTRADLKGEIGTPSVIHLGGQQAGFMSTINNRMNTGYGRLLEAQFGEKGVRGFSSYAASSGILGASSLYGAAGAASFAGGAAIGGRLGRSSMAYSQLGLGSIGAEQRMAMGGLGSALGGDYSELMAETFGQTGRIRKGNLNLGERMMAGSSMIGNWLTFNPITSEEAAEGVAQKRLQKEKGAAQYLSQGMRERVRISNQFRNLGQTFGDVTDTFGSIQGQTGVGSQDMNKIFSMFQGMQMMPSGDANSKFYQGMQQYGVSSNMMQQIVRQQRMGNNFNSNVAAGTMTGLLSSAGLGSADQGTRQYVTDIMARAMGAEQSDITSAGAGAMFAGAAAGAINTGSGLNSLYSAQQGIEGAGIAFNSVNSAGSYENSLVREQLKGMGLDTTLIQTLMSAGITTNPEVMQWAADGLGYKSIGDFRSQMMAGVKNFHAGQRDVMGNMSAKSKGVYSAIKSNVSDKMKPKILRNLKKKYQGQSSFEVGGVSYQATEKGFNLAAENQADDLVMGMDVVDLAKTGGNVDKAMFYNEAEDIQIDPVTSGGRVKSGKETVGVKQEQATAALMSKLVSLVSGEGETSVFKTMNDKLADIETKLASLQELKEIADNSSKEIVEGVSSSRSYIKGEPNMSYLRDSKAATKKINGGD